MGLILCPTARAGTDEARGPSQTAPEPPGIRFEPSVPADQARRWEAGARTAWAEWEARFRARAERPPLTVGLADASSLLRDLGRSRSSRIELNGSLPRAAADATFRHELAHVFLESRCPGLARASPLLSEAFALHASGDAPRRLADAGGFPGLAAARDWLVLNAGDAAADERAATRALVRVLGRGGAGEPWDAVFAGLLGGCRDASFSTSRALADFLDAVRGADEDPPVSRADFLLLDGLSGETLAADGRTGARFPAGSILKPSLVAAVPALMEPRAARDAAAWRCPGPPARGERMTWEAALQRSCNGFFLDFPSGTEDAFAAWEDTLGRLGFAAPPRTMEGRIGLLGDYGASAAEVVRLYSWLDLASPHVVDALRMTASEGTLAPAAEAPWFAARGIALKTGTVRGARSEPLHAWIVAVGPRSPAGTPAFVAALHATGRATSSLLPELRRRLAAALTGLESPADVQVLGLVPPGSVAAGCAAGIPLAVREPGGAWRLEEPGAVRPMGALGSGGACACPGSALVLSFPGADGTPRVRAYHGTLRVEPPPPGEPHAGVPLRARSARARAGSRYVLATSLLSYLTSSVLSEAPSAHTEVQKALALAVASNRLSRRHGERPPCDTTHCSLFGHDERVPARTRQRARAAVANVGGLTLEPPASGRAWLPFFLGGRAPWTEVRSAGEVRAELGLAADPARLARLADGSVEVEAGTVKRVPCEVLRNQLRLPSCPDALEEAAAGFVFRGAGEGHGEGLDVTAANAAAAEGADFRALLRRAFPGVDVRDAPPSPPP